MTSLITQEMKNNIEKTIDVFKKQLTSIRTGRAHGSLLDPVKVDYYNVPTPLAQVAAITISDARTILVKPWEKNMQKPIEKAIQEANLGLLAVTDSDVIRVSVPMLTEERRKEFCKQCKSKAEEAKLAVRNYRRDANELLKNATKKGEVSEDEEKRALKITQEYTDLAVSQIDELCLNKEQEIMKI